MWSVMTDLQRIFETMMTNAIPDIEDTSAFNKSKMNTYLDPEVNSMFAGFSMGWGAFQEVEKQRMVEEKEKAANEG